MNTFYIASSLSNIDTVRLVRNQLIKKGFVLTYDWTKNERASTIEDLMEIGTKEKKAVLEADFIVVLLPAGKGSHIEFGMALSQGMPIYLYSPNDDINNIATTSTFYHLSNVEKCVGTIDVLVEKITKSELNRI
ncbi:group-specific protein [Virgibacillus halodenitrificans]|uniref:group-specific protein n=1 Tax=Virgibacillus halodenitrificans TaxID=1482 RepID=UPI001FB3B648|nr:group-specific protein [Virgibacillus halodenitrificans]MCJ0930671.1 group-specific protein [Virgibacillus halodenitrificans]